MNRFIDLWETASFNWLTILLLAVTTLAILINTPKDENGANLSVEHFPEIIVSGKIMDRYILEGENRTIVLKKADGTYETINSIATKAYYDNEVGESVSIITQKEMNRPYGFSVFLVVVIIASTVGGWATFGFLQWTSGAVISLLVLGFAPFSAILIPLGIFIVWLGVLWNRLGEIHTAIISEQVDAPDYRDPVEDIDSIRLTGKVNGRSYFFHKVWFINRQMIDNEADAVVAKLK